MVVALVKIMEPSNLLQIPNSESNSQYLAACKELGIKEHPALLNYLNFLFGFSGDVVLDIFADNRFCM